MTRTSLFAYIWLHLLVNCTGERKENGIQESKLPWNGRTRNFAHLPLHCPSLSLLLCRMKMLMRFFIAQILERFCESVLGMNTAAKEAKLRVAQGVCSPKPSPAFVDVSYSTAFPSLKKTRKSGVPRWKQEKGWLVQTLTSFLLPLLEHRRRDCDPADPEEAQLGAVVQRPASPRLAYRPRQPVRDKALRHIPDHGTGAKIFTTLIFSFFRTISIFHFTKIQVNKRS